MYSKKWSGKQLLIGYGRVSTNEQDLSLQIDALQAAGCEKIYSDKASGTKTERPGLTDAIAFARAGDTLMVWKLDRLGRSVKDLIAQIMALEERGIEFRSLTDGIDTTTATGRFFFHVMAAFAEMERALIIERTNAGLSAARRMGRKGGRRPTMTPEKIKQATRLLATGQITPAEVAKTLGVSKATIYRHIPKAATNPQH